MTTATILHLEGDLDFSMTESVRRRMEHSLHNADRVELDLGRVSSLSSAILAVFADMQRRALDMGKAFNLGNASDGAARVLTLFRLDNVFGSPTSVETVIDHKVFETPLQEAANSPVDQPIDTGTGQSPMRPAASRYADSPSAPAAASCNRLY